MLIQITKFETKLTEEEVVKRAKERSDRFRALPGLLQKYYIKLDNPKRFGAVYIWDSRESFEAYRTSDIAKTLPEAYQIVGKPDIELIEGLFALRD